MTDETELVRKQTALVAGAKTKMGTLVVTPTRLIFMDQKFAGGAGGVIGVVVADRLQKRHEDGGPLLDLAVSDITGVRREKKLMNKNRIVLITASGEHVINDGWAEINAALREALTGQGIAVTDDGADAWNVH